MSELQGHVKVPHSFFMKARLEYADWRFATIRELIQNSYDAQATHVQFRFAKTVVQDKECLELVCSDNGCGMSKDVLLNVFLSMGGTTKQSNEGSADVGGMGYAKTLLAFSNVAYFIETMNHLVSGEGGNYRYETVDAVLPGTRFTLLIEPSKYETTDSLMNTLIDNIQTLVNHANLRKDFSISVVKPESSPYRVEKDSVKMTYHINTDLGKVAFKDAVHECNSSLWVRVRGLPMFEHSIYSDNSSAFVGVLDLDGHPLEMLTSNRDGLKSEYSRKLTHLFERLSNERSSLKIDNLFDFEINQTTDIPIINSHQETFHEDFLETGAESDSEAILPIIRANSICKINQLDSEDTQNPFHRLIKDTRKKVETLENRLSTLDTDRYPVNFVVSAGGMNNTKEYTHLIRELGKARLSKIAQQWKAAVLATLISQRAHDRLRISVHSIDGKVTNEDQFMLADDMVAVRWDYSVGEGEAVPIRLGFIFDDNLQAVNRYINKDHKREYQLLINPHNLPNDFQMDDILDLAHHEVAHFNISSHNESFCYEHIQVIRSQRRAIKNHLIRNKAKNWF